MRTAFKILISYCLTVAVLLSLVSCEWNLTGSADETDTTDAVSNMGETQGTATETTPMESASESTPKETTTSHFDETLPEQTSTEQNASSESTLEQTEPQVTEPDRTTSFGEVTTYDPMTIAPEEITNPETTTNFEEVTTHNPITTPEVTTAPEGITTPEATTNFDETTQPKETTTPEPPHEHKIVNGQCVCGYILVVENVSQYDNDGDGNKDVFYFSSVLPERFTSKNAIHFEAGEYMPYLSSWVGTPYEAGDNYYFCRSDRKSYIVYEIEVAEAGVYEMAIYQRMKDTELRGAKFTVNEGSDGKYTLSTSYQFVTEQALTEVCEGTTALASYMFGIELELVAGVNSIKIELGPGIADSQYFREFYLIKASE